MRRPGVLAIAVLLMAAAYGLFGQAGAHPVFQSASIKRNTSNWNERFRHPMSMGVNSSLFLLIQFAYAPHDNPMQGHSLPLLHSQVLGGPDWIDSEGYDIVVRPKTNDRKQLDLMWQNLLADRFKLRLHRETREVPAYNLTVASSGLKLPPAKPAGCVSFPPGTTPRYVPGKVDCGYVTGPFLGARAAERRIEGRKIHMADLIKELAFVLDRPILDQTGFTGEFDLNLSFASDGTLPALQNDGPADPNLPDVFGALEEQLGLKLVPAKAALEVLIIDHAERPLEN